jgi:imidazolonepropionase-like amidohydrolase
VHFQWAQPQAVGWKPATVGHLRRILDAQAEHLRRAHEMGVTLLVGTDAGSIGVEHGFAVADEIDRFAEAGLPMQAVLTAATSAPRRHFGAAHTTLVAGAGFDALLLPVSPFIDRAALRRPKQVWSSGVAAPWPG